MSTMRRFLPVTLVALAVLGGCNGDSRSVGSTPAGRELTGTFTWTGGATGDPCTPADGSRGPVDGTMVAVFDTTGNLLVTGSLGAGRADGTSCVHPLDVPAVADLDAYRVTIGRIGPIEVTREAIEAAGGKVDLRFGA